VTQKRSQRWPAKRSIIRPSIPVGKVLGSGLCSALETGRLAFGRVEASDALLIESFVPIAGAPVPPPWPQRVETMKEMIATVPEAGTNTVLITHFPNIKAALGFPDQLRRWP
jgi:hypothetical protein